MIRNKYEVARRSIWYVLRTLAVTIAIMALAWGVFVYAMHVSNLYILATEGMELRAECIVTNGSVLSLSEHFTQEFIENDEILYEGRYKEFIVDNYDYRIDVESISVMPWSVTASMQVTEKMASMSAAPNDESDANAEKPFQEWIPARYRISFVRQGARWYISALTLIEENPPEKQLPTPDMSLLNTASAEPTIAASPTLSPEPLVTE